MLYWLDDGPDDDWLGAVAGPALVDDAWRAWRGEVAFAEKFVTDSPDLKLEGFGGDDTRTTLRSVLIHMIEDDTTRAETITKIYETQPRVGRMSDAVSAALCRPSWAGKS